MEIEGYADTDRNSLRTPKGTYIGIIGKWLEKRKDGKPFTSKQGNLQVVAIYKPLAIVEVDKGVNMTEADILASEHWEYYVLVPQNFFKIEKLALAVGVEPEDTGKVNNGKPVHRINTDSLCNKPLRFTITEQTVAGQPSGRTEFMVSALQDGDDVPEFPTEGEDPGPGDDDMPF